MPGGLVETADQQRESQQQRQRRNQDERPPGRAGEQIPAVAQHFQVEIGVEHPLERRLRADIGDLQQKHDGDAQAENHAEQARHRFRRQQEDQRRQRYFQRQRQEGHGRDGIGMARQVENRMRYDDENDYRRRCAPAAPHACRSLRHCCGHGPPPDRRKTSRLLAADEADKDNPRRRKRSAPPAPARRWHPIAARSPPAA